MALVAPPNIRDVAPYVVEDAVIREARRRARRRRMRWVAVVAAFVAAAVAAVGSRMDEPPRGVDGPPIAQGAGEAADTSRANTLLAQYGAVHVGWVLVYGDGRVLWLPDHEPVLERRLAGSALAQVRAGSLEPADLPHVSTTSPQGIWAESEAHEYRPTAYAACLWAGPNQPGAVDALPRAARVVVSGAPPAPAGHVVAESWAASGWNCLRLGSAALTALARTTTQPSRAVGIDRTLSWSRDGSTTAVTIHPIMPHGRWIAWGG